MNRNDLVEMQKLLLQERQVSNAQKPSHKEIGKGRKQAGTWRIVSDRIAMLHDDRQRGDIEPGVGNARL